MSMSDDVGNMVAGGVAAGVAAGLQYQHDAQAARSDDVARSWKRYAEELRRQVLDRDIELSEKNILLTRKDSELARKDKAIGEINQSSTAEIAEWKSLIELLRDKVTDLQRKLRHSSANGAVLNKLLERVLDDIAHVSDPTKFPSLDPAVWQETMETEWAHFEETGQLEFKPRIAIRPRQP